MKRLCFIVCLTTASIAGIMAFKDIFDYWSCFSDGIFISGWVFASPAS
ncbi:hypothetical protein [Peribacillus frigoritolerans]|nr:hypothetical protein [Peribacillus frigoritolerans]USK75947.1 hypothetical protein LIT31_05100 [Peribacillus frigoritolerans]